MSAAGHSVSGGGRSSTTVCRPRSGLKGTVPQPVRGGGIEEGREARGFPGRARLILGAQLDETLRHTQLLLGKRHRLDREGDRALLVETTPDDDTRIPRSLVEVDADEGAPSLRVIAPERDRFPLPSRGRRAGRGLRFHLDEDDSALRRRGRAGARTRWIAVRGSGWGGSGERESDEGEDGIQWVHPLSRTRRARGRGRAVLASSFSQLGRGLAPPGVDDQLVQLGAGDLGQADQDGGEAVVVGFREEPLRVAGDAGPPSPRGRAPSPRGRRHTACAASWVPFVPARPTRSPSACPCSRR